MLTTKAQRCSQHWRRQENGSAKSFLPSEKARAELGAPSDSTLSSLINARLFTGVAHMIITPSQVWKWCDHVKCCFASDVALLAQLFCPFAVATVGVVDGCRLRRVISQRKGECSHRSRQQLVRLQERWESYAQLKLWRWGVVFFLKSQLKNRGLPNKHLRWCLPAYVLHMPTHRVLKLSELAIESMMMDWSYHPFVYKNTQQQFCAQLRAET